MCRKDRGSNVRFPSSFLTHMCTLIQTNSNVMLFQTFIHSHLIVELKDKSRIICHARYLLFALLYILSSFLTMFMASVGWPRDHINRPPYFLSYCWDRQMGSPGRRWMEGNRMRSVNLFPWLPPLKFSQIQSQFLQGVLLCRTLLKFHNAPFSNFFGSQLITTHLIAHNSHNLITLLKYFHFCILFV